MEGLVARGFRNLAPTELTLPPEGIALLGANAQGKTNLLEALYYSVLFRSFRGATDSELARFDGPGFRVESTVMRTGKTGTIATEFRVAPKRKRIEVDGAESSRLMEAMGHWVAVAFLPSDVVLASGPGAERRRYLDRLLCLADSRYLTALTRYRSVLSQRNAALRHERRDVVQAFDEALASAGAAIVSSRVRWADTATSMFAEEFAALGEQETVGLSYRGRAELAAVDAWPGAIEEAWPADSKRGVTTVGPHRDDLILEIGGRALREYGSTGQQRSAVIALKLLELSTLSEAYGTEPALVLDDVFAELDTERQNRLVTRLDEGARRQVFVTAPRRDELPEGLTLPVWNVKEGRVTCP
ncbi:MAG: DNA replication and repair protein RecF [Gemmatimonadales bacterium]|nr:DNA replication and repair protein RecF [Gemmatimonadales bacterium]